MKESILIFVIKIPSTFTFSPFPIFYTFFMFERRSKATPCYDNNYKNAELVVKEKKEVYNSDLSRSDSSTVKNLLSYFLILFGSYIFSTSVSFLLSSCTYFSQKNVPFVGNKHSFTGIAYIFFPPSIFFC